jgi:hypothetical protein
VLLDANGNRVAQAGVSVSAVLATGGGGSGSERQNVATTDATGKATFTSLTLIGLAGPATVRFDASSLASVTSGTITLTAGAASALSVVTEPPATAESGAAFSQQPAVALRDGIGNPVAQSGVIVTATIASGTGSIGNASATTGTDGVAHFAGLAVTGTAGNVTLSFAASGVTAVNSTTISITAGTPTQLVLYTAPSATAMSGAAFAQPPVIQLHDASGNVVTTPGVSVAAMVSNSGTLVGSATATTDALGRATFTGLGISGTAGPFTLTFSATGLTPATASVTVVAGAAASITILAGTPQAGLSRAVVPVATKVAVHDGAGNPVAGVAVLFTAGATEDSVAAGGSFARSATVTTTAAGEAALTGWKLGASGYDTVTATVAAVATPALFVATDSIGPATHFALVHGGGQSAPVTGRLADSVIVEARDDNENPVPNVQVEVNGTEDQGAAWMFGRPPCGDCIQPTSSTDANGQAWFVWYVGSRTKTDSLLVENETIGATLVTARADVGPAIRLNFFAPSGLDDDLGNTLSPFHVVFTDAGGVDTVAVNGPVTLGLNNTMSCEICGTASGTLTVNALNGIASFDDIQISQTGTYYFTATSGGLNGTSDYFDISPVGPHFVVVGSYPTNNLVGSTVQIQLRSQTAHGDPLPNTTVMVSLSGDYGSVQLAGGAYGGSRDSATTDSNGLITLSWTMPSSTRYELMANVSNYQTAQPLQLLANSVAGPPAQLVPLSEGGYDDDVGNVLNTIQVRVTDAAGNSVTNPGGSVTVSLEGGDADATLRGTLTQPVAYDGTVYFSDLTIDKPGLSYKLRFTWGALTGETPEFDISPVSGGGGVATIDPTVTQLLLTPNSSRAVTFVVKDGAGAPVANQHVTIYSNDPATCYFGAPGTGTRTTYTDASGIATGNLSTSAANGGCHIQGTTFTGATTLVTHVEAVSYAGSATHVWFGNGSETSNFNIADNWIRVADGQPSIPGSADGVYLPANVNFHPQILNSDHTLAAVEMEPGATLTLNGTALLVTGNVAASGALIDQGTVTVTGTSSASGSFGALTLGQSGCASDQLTVHDVSVSGTLRVVCHTSAGANVSADSLVVLPATDLLMSGPTSQISANNAVVDGAMLSLNGTFGVNVNALLRPANLAMTSTSRLTVGGDAQLGANGTSQLTLAGKIYVQGALLEQGQGTSTADTITVHGNATFDGRTFTLPSGVLDLGGDLRTGASYTQSAIQASGNHTTRFSGTVPQTMSLTYAGLGAGQSKLARVQVTNIFSPVTFFAYALVSGPDSLRLEVQPNASLIMEGGGEVQGNVHLDYNSSLTLNGQMVITSPAWLRLLDNAHFIVNSPVNFTGNCTDTYQNAQAQGLTITGSGLIYGNPPTNLSCTAS